MQWLCSNAKPRVQLQEITGPPGCSLDRYVRMWTEYVLNEGVNITVTINIQNSSDIDLTDIRIRA